MKLVPKILCATLPLAMIGGCVFRAHVNPLQVKRLDAKPNSTGKQFSIGEWKGTLTKETLFRKSKVNPGWLEGTNSAITFAIGIDSKLATKEKDLRRKVDSIAEVEVKNQKGKIYHSDYFEFSNNKIASIIKTMGISTSDGKRETCVLLASDNGSTICAIVNLKKNSPDKFTESNYLCDSIISHQAK